MVLETFQFYFRILMKYSTIQLKIKDIRECSAYFREFSANCTKMFRLIFKKYFGKITANIHIFFSNLPANNFSSKFLRNFSIFKENI